MAKQKEQSEELAVLSPIETEIAQLVKTTKNVSVTPDRPKADRDAVHASLMQHVNLRVRIEKLAKELRDPHNKVIKEILAKEKDLLAQTTPTEERLRKERDAWDKAREDEQKEKEEAERKRIQERVSMLLKAGMAYSGTEYELVNDDEVLTITDVSVRILDDEDFHDFLEKVQVMAAEIKEAKAKAEAERKAEEQRLKDEAARLERQRLEQEQRAAELERRAKALEQRSDVVRYKEDDLDVEFVSMPDFNDSPSPQTPLGDFVKKDVEPYPVWFRKDDGTVEVHIQEEPTGKGDAELLKELAVTIASIKMPAVLSKEAKGVVKPVQDRLENIVQFLNARASVLK